MEFFDTAPYYLRNGMTTDQVSVGDPISTDSLLLTVRVGDDDITQSVYTRRHEVIASHITGTNTKLKQFNMLYSDRLRFKYGRGVGSGTQTLFTPCYSEQETFFDSYVPNPIDISLTNEVELGYLNPVSGVLSPTTTPGFNLPESRTDIPIIFGNSVPAGFPEELVDTTWLSSPYPYQTRYKGLKRLLQSSFQLPEPMPLTRDMTTHAAVSPPSQSNVIGTVYYVSDESATGIVNQVFFGEDQGALNEVPPAPDPIFTEGAFPVVSAGILQEWYGSDASDFVRPFKPYAQQLLVGTSGSIMRREQGGTWYFTSTATPVTKTLRDATHSKGGYFGFQHQFGIWVVVGDNGTILTSSLMDPGVGSFGIVNPGGTYSGSFYGVANQQNVSSLVSSASGKFVAVGAAGEIQHSVSGSTWIRNAGSPFEGGTFAFRAIDYNTDSGSECFVAVGDGGRIYVSNTADGASTWTKVTQVGNLSTFTDNLHAVTCFNNNGGPDLIVVAGENGAIAVNDGTSLTTENSWTVIAPPAGYTGTFYGAARSMFTNNPRTHQVYLVGDDGMICGVNATTADAITPSPAAVTHFKTITSFGIWSYPLRSWPSYGDYLIAGTPVTSSLDFIGRVCDVETNDYVYDPTFETFINVGENIILQDPGTGPGTTFVRSTLQDGFRTYYGFGKGAAVVMGDGDWLPSSNFTFMKNSAVEFIDTKFWVDDASFETFRFISPKPQGFRYGIMNVTPQSTRCVFNRNHYGQFRDMLEQRQSSKMLLGNSLSTTVDSPVRVTFLSGSTAYDRAIVYLTASSPTDFNPRDSGAYDYEYRSGMPFFDNLSGGID